MAHHFALDQPIGLLAPEDHVHPVLRADPFVPSALLGDWGHTPLALRERTMLWLMNEITDMPEWTKLVRDEGAIANWCAQLADPVMASSPLSPKEDGECATSRQMAASQSPLPPLPSDLAATGFTGAMLDACVAELRANANICERQKHSMISVFDADAAVVKAYLPLVDDAKAALASLEAEAHVDADYRPDHGFAVLPLAHSSLYPIVYGRTRAVDSPSITRENCIGAIGTGTTMPSLSFGPIHIGGPRKERKREALRFKAACQETIGHLSNRFAWLPTDVAVIDGRPRLQGYINNVHPRHEAVYALVERLLTFALPCFRQATEVVKRNRTSHHDDTDRRRARHRERRMPWVEPGDLLVCRSPERACSSELLGALTAGYGARQRTLTWEELYRIVISCCWSNRCRAARDVAGVCYIEPAKGRGSQEELEDEFVNNVPDHGERLPYTRRKRRMEEFAALHPVVQPEPKAVPHFSDYDLAPWSDKTLQVIVQINNHELTPDNPTYAGGQWHVEGLLNEHIVGSAIFYYDEENITESRLAFAAPCGPVTRDADDRPIRQRCGGEDSSLSVWDRCVRSDARTQVYGDWTGRSMPLGAVKATPGRMVVFPNVLEHRVEPFQLVDSTRPGHRKMVGIFLIDPELTIMSTSRVPPQQLHWADASTLAGVVQEVLPPEISLQVFDHVPCPYDDRTARTLRDELMGARGRGLQGTPAKVGVLVAGGATGPLGRHSAGRVRGMWGVVI